MPEPAASRGAIQQTEAKRDAKIAPNLLIHSAIRRSPKTIHPLRPEGFYVDWPHPLLRGKC